MPPGVHAEAREPPLLHLPCPLATHAERTPDLSEVFGRGRTQSEVTSEHVRFPRGQVRQTGLQSRPEGLVHETPILTDDPAVRHYVLKCAGSVPGQRVIEGELG